MNNLIKLFDMGSHTPYVWSSYGIFFFIMISLFIYSIKRLSNAKKSLKAFNEKNSDTKEK